MQTEIKRRILAGSTPRIAFSIGFMPETLTLSIYDTSYTPVGSSVLTTFPPYGSTPLTDTIVNSRDEVDIFDHVDSSGEVEFYLSPEDTAVTVPTGSVPSEIKRRLMFTWTWDGGEKVGKHLIIINITPDRKP